MQPKERMYAAGADATPYPLAPTCACARLVQPPGARPAWHGVASAGGGRGGQQACNMLQGKPGHLCKIGYVAVARWQSASCLPWWPPRTAGSISKMLACYACRLVQAGCAWQPGRLTSCVILTLCVIFTMPGQARPGWLAPECCLQNPTKHVAAICARCRSVVWEQWSGGRCAYTGCVVPTARRCLLPCRGRQ